MEVNEISGSKLFTVSDVLTAEECDQFIANSELEGYKDAPISTAGGFVMRKDVRNNTRVMSDHVEDANYLWERLKPFLPAKVGTEWHVTGLNERFRFYRYEPGQYFAWHYDGSFRRSEIEESLYTLMVYLNDDFTGGETKFELKYPHEQVVVTPKKGMALLFEHYQFHEGSAVTAGIKYVLRSDVMYRRGHGSALLNLVK